MGLINRLTAEGDRYTIFVLLKQDRLAYIKQISSALGRLQQFKTTYESEPSMFAAHTLGPALLIGCFTISLAFATERDYPESRKDSVTDTYHGVQIADPYRWLEDSDSAETRAWIEAQNRLTGKFLDEIPQRKAIEQRLTQLWDYTKYSAPIVENGRYFLSKNDGLQNQSVFFVQDGLDAKPRMLLDPNTWSADGTVALSGLYPSDDGHYAAYSVSESGSDWITIKVRDVQAGQDLSDVLKWIKFSGASWDAKNQGFYYSRYAKPEEGEALLEVNKNQKLYYHRLGTPQEEDVLVYERPDQPEWGFHAGVTEDGRYLIISIGQGTDRRNRLYYQDLKAENAKVTPLFDQFDASYSFVGNTETVFYILTDLDAPNKRLVAVDISKPESANWTTLVAQSDDVIQGVGMANNQFVISALEDVKGRLTIHDLDGTKVKEIELPALGSVFPEDGKRSDSQMFYTFTSFTYPQTIYRYDFKTGESTVFRESEVDFDPDQYVTKQVFYHSKDGTRVPMFIVYKQGLKLDGQNPTYLYGYGGFNISLTPNFSPGILGWMELGGVFALPNLRGGGEYGEKWHRGGMLESKQNVFDDFIAAAEYLIKAGYTSTPKLAIGGRSNGGLLVGAAVTQRPDLFGAALPGVGVLDMLRFHKFTIGWAWVNEYGSADDAEQFKILYAYSPLHNVKSGTVYPPTMVSTGDHDDRVVPGHSFKFAAAMQAAQGGQGEVLIRIDTKAGHGAGKPTRKAIEEQADNWAFLIRALGMQEKMKPAAALR